MFRVIGMVLLAILTSFYFFPFEFTFLPGINTKMAMAGISLCVLIAQLACKRSSIINRDFFELSLLSGVVSLISFFAAIFNDTYDYTYATYIISMWVWIAAAYLVILMIRKLHGEVTIQLVINYLIVVCVVQCLVALSLDMFRPLKLLVSSFYSIDMEQKRLAGIGAGLDVAGTRFAAVLIMLIYQVVMNVTADKKVYIGLYMLAFIIISVAGNMISRTTTVGLLISLCYLVYVSKVYMFRLASNIRYIFMWLLFIILIFMPVIAYEYATNLSFQKHFYFGFEGFFSLVEKGKWEVHSNEILKGMYIFPDNLKTWFLGDGYLNNPFDTEPYYTGIDWHGYYQNTDVGYLRFIFYFGLFGLILFCVFMCKTCKVCMNYFMEYRGLFLIILLLNFVIWLKVSTDLFLVFALFLALSYNKENNSIKIDSQL